MAYKMKKINKFASLKQLNLLVMKKYLFWSLLGLCSCSENQIVNGNFDEDVTSVGVRILEMEGEVSSRMEVTDKMQYLWELTDTLGIFPSKGGQVEFPITEESISEDRKSAYFEGGGWALKGGYSYSAYNPYNFYNRDATAIPFSYEGQVQTGTDNREHLSSHTLLIASPTAVESGKIYFNLKNVGCLLRLDLTLPEAKTYKSLKLYADSEIIPIKKTFNILSSDIPEKVVSTSNHLSFGLENITTTAANQQVRLWVSFPTMSQPAKTLKAVVTDSNGYVYVGDVFSNNENVFYLDLARNSGKGVKSSPVLTDGFTGGIEDWQIGEEIAGVAQ